MSSKGRSFKRSTASLTAMRPSRTSLSSDSMRARSIRDLPSNRCEKVDADHEVMASYKSQLLGRIALTAFKRVLVCPISHLYCDALHAVSDAVEWNTGKLDAISYLWPRLFDEQVIQLSALHVLQHQTAHF